MSERDRKETGGKTGRWSTSCGRVKAGQGGEGAAGADASSHMRSKKRGQPRPEGDMFKGTSTF